MFWNNTIYTTENGAPICALAVSNGSVAATPLARSKKVASGHSPIISSNGTSNGLLWQLDGSALQAFDAILLERLYSSDQTADGRDVLPALPHFANLMVVNGKLYVGTNNSLVVYGLLN